eukprot:CAMPEP_0170494810 /NCGR_PEP_ID=MMETSP0208-20121228/14850_1 /TAXON_ID=197538 /ORGANISM="Strombidium inclinatum, Strain S3" /LENGTH=68 /DNA_ID=CAMNT_0010770911 /DNA_START=23 /DNA_END=229 /DNA_ORIENTATION=+
MATLAVAFADPHPFDWKSQVDRTKILERTKKWDVRKMIETDQSTTKFRSQQYVKTVKEKTPAPEVAPK